MKLSLWIYNYRKEHALSMQAMADLCGLSKQYVSVLEKGINPNTKKEFVPSIETVKKIADGTGTDLTTLISLLGKDQEFVINSTVPFPSFEPSETEMILTNQEQELITDFRKLNSAGQKVAAKVVKNFTTDPDYAIQTEQETEPASKKNDAKSSA